jgi:cytochrome c oxidase cbb3-type subunit 3
MKGKALCAIALAVTLLACEREQRRLTGAAPAAARPQPAPMTDLKPGPAGTPPAPATASAMKPVQPGTGPYDENAWAVSEGKRLYSWYNCLGCHANGGGGMGPPLMDDKWIYGSSPENIHDSIVQGRPNGMPAFAGKIPDAEVWQLVAYVRALGGLLRKDIRPTRNDHMSVRASEQARSAETPKKTGPLPSSPEQPR